MTVKTVKTVNKTTKTVAKTETRENRRLQVRLKRIAENEAAYKAATSAEKRVMIARDVIAALKAETMTTRTGAWLKLFETKTCVEGGVSYKVKSIVYGGDFDRGVQFRDVLMDGTTCSVCAIGAMFVATVMRKNKITVQDALNKTISPSGGFRVISSFLRDAFPQNQLALIECAFERGCGYISPDTQGPNLTDEMCNKAVHFGEENAYNNGLRLIAIMKNIIKNKGTFVP